MPHVYVCIYLYIYIYIYIYIYTHMNIYIYINMSQVRLIHMCDMTLRNVRDTTHSHGVATVSRIDKIIGLFCKRDL